MTDQITVVAQLDYPVLLVAHFPFIFVYDDSAEVSLSIILSN